ncbi:putative methyltransferase-domain-containing protein [Fimicolochytrium jonesii]|uniref:putative methyltransferase-domain-containing protein n=1 Tax=Fimicolochytrium jonesii TaxID=1396493 RepID=UPI0022FE09DB|nr:putative methyltransferase-domain-containing protein [Fimicolochytrium jonesii]KAI8826226.1 putative methyltransferase-domain-containing protein [Fimicolochytrium jonesii]
MARKPTKAKRQPITTLLPRPAPSITKPTASSSTTTRLRSSQKLISTYHTLNKKLSTLVKQHDEPAAAAVRREMEAMGGLHAYQRASLAGNEKKGIVASEKWVLPFLRKERTRVHGIAQAVEGEVDKDADDATVTTGTKAKEPTTKLKMLDVGAVNGQTYAKQASWIDVSRIDLNPQEPGIEKQDFFERSLPKSDAERFHVLCLSLVVNFVGDPKARGDMLLKTLHYLLPHGLLFLALPLPCLTNSRYMTHEHFTAILTSMGYELVDHHHARKLAFYVFRKSGNGKKGKGGKKIVEWPKREMRPGGKRNNFCVVVRRGGE